VILGIILSKKWELFNHRYHFNPGKAYEICYGLSVEQAADGFDYSTSGRCGRNQWRGRVGFDTPENCPEGHWAAATQPTAEKAGFDTPENRPEGHWAAATQPAIGFLHSLI
jgi:hypothetical protein